MSILKINPLVRSTVLAIVALAFQAALACPPGAPDVDKDKAKEQIQKESAPAPGGQYTKKLWSCGCSNLRNKICDKGFEFTSMADATKYAKQVCGESCDPDCAGHISK